MGRKQIIERHLLPLQHYDYRITEEVDFWVKLPYNLTIPADLNLEGSSMEVRQILLVCIGNIKN